MSELRTDYVNDELAPSMDSKRQYEMIDNPNGTVSFVDKTAYSVVGSNFGADDLNETNRAVNEVVNNLTQISTKMILTKRITVTATGLTKNVNKEVSIDIPVVDGYTPVIASFVSSSSVYCSLTRCNMLSGKLYFVVNTYGYTGSDTFNSNLSADVLYVKTILL